MKTIRRIEVLPGSVIDRVIRREIEQADDDIVEFDFNGVVVQVEADSDPDAVHQKWRDTMDANCKRLIAEKDRQEHPEGYWTATAPVSPGWYWQRFTGNPAAVLCVYEDRGRLFVKFDDGGTPIDELKNSEWAGPIPEPVRSLGDVE